MVLVVCQLSRDGVAILENEKILGTRLHLFHLVLFIKCWQFFLELKSKGLLYQSSGKEKEGHCVVFTPSTKREIGIFPSKSCNNGKEVYKKIG